ncbi:hypothetical protein [Microvirga thermotolerans]|uniref:hypothetical protein n=1 Tax=Microvirga thermotolerans TaxID=2651334 RepID=UPI001883D1A4|nr:hypothetical protein [Microvirga thermotolerans]
MSTDRTKRSERSGTASAKDIDGPRLTPQGRTDPAGKGEDSTNPSGAGAKKGQGDKAEG